MGHTTSKQARPRKIELLVRQLRCVPAANTEAAELLHAGADYFERNRERMRYPSFRSRNLFVGSGVIEAACRTVIAKRLKTIGNILGRPWSQRHHRPSLYPTQQEI